MAENKIGFDQFMTQFNEQNRKRRDLINKKRKFSSSPNSGSPKPNKPSALSQRMKYWRPTPEPTLVRLIPNTPEDPFFTYYQSWVKNNGRSRTVLSNDHDGEHPVPCVVSHYAVADSNPNLLPARKDVITVLVLEWFYKVPKVSKAGNEYFVYQRSLGMDKYGNSKDPADMQQYEKVFGQKYHWSVGYGHKKQIMEQLDDISERCGSCKEGFISIYAYECTECGGVIADHKKDQLTDSQTHMLRTSNSVDCPHCGHSGAPKFLTECVHKRGLGSNVEWVDGCDNPMRITPWDCELLISTSGTGSSTSIVVNDWQKAVERDDVQSWKLEAFEFEEFFAYMDLEEQAKLMGRENPFDEQAQIELVNYFNNLKAKQTEKFVEPY